jgi:hypothetical protein
MNLIQLLNSFAQKELHAAQLHAYHQPKPRSSPPTGLHWKNTRSLVTAYTENKPLLAGENSPLSGFRPRLSLHERGRRKADAGSCPEGGRGFIRCTTRAMPRARLGLIKVLPSRPQHGSGI